MLVGLGNGFVGGAGAGNGEYQIEVYRRFVWVQIGFVGTLARDCGKVCLQVFFTFSEAQNVCNSFLHFLYGYKSRFGILTSQRKRLCQSITQLHQQRLNPTTTKLHQSPPAGESTEGPRACRSLCVPSAQDTKGFKHTKTEESQNEREKENQAKEKVRPPKNKEPQ